MVLSEFERASALKAMGDGTWRGDIPESWQQGRGTFGGLVLALLLRAMEQTENDASRVARALTGDICGPVQPGPVDIRVRVLRRGGRLTNAAAELTQSGQVLAVATAVLSAPQTRVAEGQTAQAPPALRWEEARIAQVGPPFGPVFGQHYVYRNSGPVPYTETPSPVSDGWIVERTPVSRLDGPALVGRLDAWWPSLLGVLGAPRSVATVSFAAQFFAPANASTAEPMRYSARALKVSEGFFLETRELWLGSELVATNQQTFAILK
jgi:acyl-CoA thioesterase